MNSKLTLSMSLAGLALCAAAVPSAPDLPAVGTASPEISAERWYNHIGRNPSLESLKGQAIMLEFWATW
ncbi:MAG TPA: hypothetical protein QF764_08355 [Planctomycetota bacterium]|jgi:hypothetical protein|nr:hypothetical protein [Planctomycetota bacterium]HJP01760.1 hypothetical protein [Planctomycetota bacterium]